MFDKNGSSNKPEASLFDEMIRGILAGAGKLVGQLGSTLEALLGSRKSVNLEASHKTGVRFGDKSPTFNWRGAVSSLSVGSGSSEVEVTNDEEVTTGPSGNPSR